MRTRPPSGDSGAVGMSIADALVAHSDADVLVVDRRHRPGGHWNDACPWVRLHIPPAYYGVGSLQLGSDSVDVSGPRASMYELASAAELCAYCGRVLDEVVSIMEDASLELEALAGAASIEDLFHRLEERGPLLRIDEPRAAQALDRFPRQRGSSRRSAAAAAGTGRGACPAAADDVRYRRTRWLTATTDRTALSSRRRARVARASSARRRHRRTVGRWWWSCGVVAGRVRAEPHQ